MSRPAGIASGAFTTAASIRETRYSRANHRIGGPMRLAVTAFLTVVLAWARPAAALDPGRADGSLSVGQETIALKIAYATH